MKNYTLYFLEFLASILVINIHSPMMIEKWRIELLTLSRFAVPFFFMVNGYFLYRSQQAEFDQTVRGRIRKNLTFTAKGLVVYFGINVVAAVATHRGAELLQRIGDPLNFFYFAVLNWTTPYFGVGHLWYLFALLYALVLLKYAMRWIRPYLLPISLVLFFTTYALEYVNFFTAHSIPEIWYRNSVLLALPCIALGCWCARNKDKILEYVTLPALLFLFFLAWVFFKLEYFVFANQLYIYIHSVLFALGALLFAMKYPKLLSGRNIFVCIGQRYTHDIYMWHYVPLILLADFGISLEHEFSFVILVMAAWIACKFCIQKIRSCTAGSGAVVG